MHIFSRLLAGKAPSVDVVAGESFSALAHEDFGTHPFFAPDGYFGILVATLCSLLGLLISLVTIYQHLLHYNIPLLQKSIIRILFITPVYSGETTNAICLLRFSVLSLLSLLIIQYYIFFDAIRDVWEAVVVYCFFSLILNYCGGENACALVIQQNPGSITAPLPFSMCLIPVHFKHAPILLRRTIPLNPAFVKACKRATLQFVAVKPIMAFITVVIALSGNGWIFENSGWLWPQGFVYNISYSIALYALALFYTATKLHSGLEEAKPLRKFAAVKLIVFATFWQSVLIFIFFHSQLSAISLRTWNLFLLCTEMPLIAVLQAWAFPVTEFKFYPDGSSTQTNSKKEQQLSNNVTAFHHQRQKSDTTFATDFTSTSLRAEDLQEDVQTARAEYIQTAVVGRAVPATVDRSAVSGSFYPWTVDQNFEGVPAVLPNKDVTVVAIDAEDDTASMFLSLPRALQRQVDAIRDPERRRLALANVRDVISVGDVMKDAYYAFGRRYANHSLLTVDGTRTTTEPTTGSRTPDPLPTPPPTPPLMEEEKVENNRSLHSK